MWGEVPVNIFLGGVPIFLMGVVEIFSGGLRFKNSRWGLRNVMGGGGRGCIFFGRG